jgi:hypothetical protein
MMAATKTKAPPPMTRMIESPQLVPKKWWRIAAITISLRAPETRALDERLLGAGSTLPF